MIKILKIRAAGLPLFKEEIEIDFFAKQRVPTENNEMLTHVFSNIYLNNVMSVVGINASGKTISLRVISFVLQMLQNKPINSIQCKDILNSLNEQNIASFEVYFVCDDSKIRKLKTCIKGNNKSNYTIISEQIWCKSTKSIRTKNNLFDFSIVPIEKERNDNELFLLDDVSIIVALNKKQEKQLFIFNSLGRSNNKGLRVLGNIPVSLIKFLDPSIEYFVCKNYEHSDKKLELHLKFFGKDEIVLFSPYQVDDYLSSGTIRGINVFIAAMDVLKKGGYILVDDLEIHFNKEIIATFIRFFMDKEVNKSGAILIFSTHYVDLLDIFDRNDNIFIIKNQDGIIIENLSCLLKRNDIKKSDLFQSGCLNGTTPSYEAYIDFKRAISILPEACEV